MRYELDINGYVLNVYWGCNSGNCAEYTGEVPLGYTSLIEWSENALINAYYIDNSGNLVLDSDKKAKLEEKAIQEAIDYTPLFAKDLYGSNAILDSQYQKQFATGTILNLENVKNISPKVKITDIDYVNYSNFNIYSHSRNMLRNDGKTETINGVSFTGLSDGSIRINGTATAEIKYNLSGSSENTIPIFVLKNNTNYYLNIGGYSCEMKYHDGETTAQVYTGASGVIKLPEDKEVTQVLLKIPKGTTINNKIIFPMLNYGTKAEPYEAYKCKVLSVDLGEPFSSDALYPSDELYPSDDLFPSGEVYATDYILIENGAIYVSRDNVVRILKAGNVQVYDGNTTLYVDNDATIEILYSIDALNIEKDFDTKLTKTKKEIKLEASRTYSTKTETSTAKQEAIDSANASTDDKLKDYSTTTEMNAAISVKADSITNSVSKTYTTKTETATAKQEAINSANNSTDSKLNNYSTKEETKASKTEAINSANSNTDNKLKDYSTTVEMNAAITTKANEINLEVGKKVNNEDFTGGNILLKINGDTSEAQINADKININGTVSANGNFKVDTNGNMECNNATFKGGEVLLKDGTEDNPMFEIASTRTNARTYITPTELQAGDGETYLSYVDGFFSVSDKNGGSILLTRTTDGSHSSFTMGVDDAYVVQGNMHALQFLYDSLKDLKKNITPFNENAIDLIKNIDIYEYNFKCEDDNTKKHIGFVIGDDYNYTKKVTGKDNTGVDNYAYTSLCVKAIQEQQKIIEDLQKQIKELKEVKQ